MRKSTHTKHSKKQARQTHTGNYRSTGQNFWFIDPIISEETAPNSLDRSETHGTNSIHKWGITPVFVHGSKALDALNGDEVEYILFPGKYGKTEGRIVSIRKRSPLPHFWILDRSGRYTAVRLFEWPLIRLASDPGASTQQNSNKSAKQGDTVGIRVVGSGRSTIGELIEIVGNQNAPGYYVRLALLQSGVPMEFPENVRNTARKIAPKRIETESHRLDLRARPIITIDGPDAKDLDDAIDVEKIPGWYVLWVHIADVSAYVEPGSEIDSEAFRRGTSVYLPDRVIPMLPGELSNHLCSLHPGWPKLCFSIRIELDTEGIVRQSTLHETVIESKHRATYEEVEKHRTGQKSPGLSGEIDTMLIAAWELREILVQRRKREGKIEFLWQEYKLKVEAGKLVDLYTRPHLESENLIEEFMVLANEEVAKHASKKKLPFLYRVHEPPTEIGISRLRDILEPLGIEFQPKNEERPTSKELQRVVELVREKDPEWLRTRDLLSCMTKALYSEKSTGHFGLALRFYSHFTSPIRRYPDLRIHQILKYSLRSDSRLGTIDRIAKELPITARQCSTLERRAELLEYTIRDTYICEWLSERIGETFDGRITTRLENGYFVQILPGIEGFVPLGGNRIQRFGKGKTRAWVQSNTNTSSTDITPGSQGVFRLVRADVLTRRIDLERLD